MEQSGYISDEMVVKRVNAAVGIEWSWLCRMHFSNGCAGMLIWKDALYILE